MKTLSNASIFTLVLLLFLIPYSCVLAVPTSTNFQLLDYGLGAGGVATSSSESFLLQGIAGEMETGSPSSTNFIALPGLTYTLEPNTPAAPSFTNPSNYYNQLKIIIDNGSNSSDTTFAIAVSTDSFSSDMRFVQADHTLGTNPVWQTYTAWNSGTGFNMIGLTPGTTYYAKVAAKRGTYQQGAFGGIATAATINPTLSFNLQTSSQSVPPFSVAIGNLTAGNVTTSSDKVTSTISTNATGGGLIYVYGTNNGLKSSTAGNYVVGSVSNDLNSLLEGYGARGTAVTESLGGPMELISPYDGSGENVGILDTQQRLFADSTGQPVTSGQATFELKAKAKDTTPSANDYSDILTVVAVGSF